MSLKKRKKSIESSALFKGIHGEVITESEEECSRFISETSHTKQADLKDLQQNAWFTRPT